jgi:vitamin K-dependent gamma-carboxylase
MVTADATRTNRWTAIRAALTAPRDVAALAAFRVGLGAIVLVSALRFLGYGWIEEMFVRPTFHFSYWGFSWIPMPSSAVTYALFVVMAVLGALVALGLFYRPAIAALFVVFTYLQLVDVANYLNHYYLVSVLSGLMFFVPAHRAYSLDAWRRPGIRATALPAWCTYLLQFQVAIVYFNAGLAKATSDWLLHAQPMRIWLAARSGLPVIGAYLELPPVAYAAAWAGFLFDTTISFFLLWRRARPYAYVAVLSFHLITHLLFPPIGMFPVIMVVAALVFFDASWPRRLAAYGRRLVGRVRPAPVPSPVVALAVPSGGGRWLRAGVAVAATFMAIQFLLPLRSHFYAGNVLWHEQGMRFSWRVMARAKNGSVTFNVRDRATGREWQVPPSRYLTRQQEREMAVQPDLILQLAHHIAGEFARNGYPGVEVRADARASLNGRRAEHLLDPSIDLAREADGIGGKRWITQAPADAPPHLRPIRSGPRNL